MRLGKNQKHVLNRMKKGWGLVTDRHYGGGYELQRVASDGRILSEKISKDVFSSLRKKELIKFHKKEGYHNFWILTKEGMEILG